MSTFGELVEEILDQLQGFTSSPDQMVALSESINATDMAFRVEDAGEISRGIAEIDDELVYVRSVDQSSGTVNIAWRGYRATTPASHLAGVPVRYAPTWTRSSIKRDINRQLLRVYPDLYAVRAAPLISSDGSTYQFDLPETAERIVDVRWKFNSIDGWQRARAWEAEHSAPSDFTGGRFLSVYEAIPPGSQLQVLYACRPSVLVADEDEFESTGLHEGAADVITLGVMARLSRMLDAARLSDQTIEADQLDQPRAIGTAAAVANDLFRQYQIRLEAEQRALSARYPARYHRTR